MPGVSRYHHSIVMNVNRCNMGSLFRQAVSGMQNRVFFPFTLGFLIGEMTGDIQTPTEIYKGSLARKRLSSASA